jgi:hypothetical protein
MHFEEHKCGQGKEKCSGSKSFADNVTANNHSSILEKFLDLLIPTETVEDLAEHVIL